MSRKSNDPAAIAAEIERLKAALATAEAAERERKLDELAKLLGTKQQLDAALDWARERFARGRRAVV